MDDVPPATLLAGRYQLLEPVGSGATGFVHRAWDHEAGRPVALKSLARRDADALFRLKHEFRSLSRIVHPNLLRLYELVVDEQQCFFAAEFIEGARTLAEHLRAQALASGVDRDPQRPRAPPEAATCHAFRQLALALAALHAAGKVHRDLKPTNVLVDQGGRVVVLDFGLVGGLESQLSRESHVGSFVGTLAYMSPEQALGRPLTPASDWYSVGVMLFECLTGRSPLRDATPAELADRSRVRIAPPQAIAAGVPAALADLALALLAVDPAARPDAARVLAVLRDRDSPESEDSGRPPLAAQRPGFVGRAAELAMLRTAYATSQKSDLPVVVTLEGPSGIGKTALIEHFLGDLSGAEALILRSRCLPHEIVPFEALDEAIDELSRFLVAQPPERLEALMPREVDALRTLFPVLGRVRLPASRRSATVEADPHALRRQGFEALRELLGRIADRRPVVIWVDDLQWGDVDSEPLLRELLRLPRAPSVLWLLAYRSEERAENPLLLALDELTKALPQNARPHLAVAPLSAQECRELATMDAAPTVLDKDALDAIAVDSGGSPFLVGELARRRLRPRHERGRLGESGFADALDALLSDLSQEARVLLETIVVATRPLERATALEAAGVSGFDPDLIPSLERMRLLRVTLVGGRGVLKIYHDRIREALAERLAPDVRRARHRGLAAALERRGSADAQALLEHQRGAGALARAAFHALRAADQAAAQLAFDQAAHYYRTALELDPAGVDGRAVLERLAEALANGGRGRGAADAFEGAADHARRVGAHVDFVRLGCRAAEQYLVSGHVDEGIQVLRPLLSGLGIPYPKSAERALADTLASVPRLAVRYARFRGRPATALPAETGLAIDACHAAAKGLVVVDPALAASFAVRSLVVALGSGDVWRTGRALCVVGASLVPLGGPLSAWALRMLRWAERIAADTRDPYLEGMTAISSAQASFVAGRWQEMLERCDRGTRLLSEHCKGVRWEREIGEMGAVRALEELGRVPELEARVDRLLESARALDDVYAQVTFLLYWAYWRLAKGDAAGARRAADEAMGRWGREAFQLQHLYEVRVLAYCDLHDGDPASAWRRVREAWGSVEASKLLRHPLLASDAHQMRANVALGLAQREPSTGLLRIAERAARTLARMQRLDARAAARRIRAGVANLRGNRAGALELLAQAAHDYEVAHMGLHAAYVRRRHAELAGEAGRSELEACDVELASKGIRDPARWLCVQAPGLAASS